MHLNKIIELITKINTIRDTMNGSKLKGHRIVLEIEASDNKVALTVVSQGPHYKDDCYTVYRAEESDLEMAASNVIAFGSLKRILQGHLNVLQRAKAKADQQFAQFA